MNPGDIVSSFGSTAAHIMCGLGQVTWFLFFCQKETISHPWLWPTSPFCTDESIITLKSGSGAPVSTLPHNYTLWPQTRLVTSVSVYVFIYKMGWIILVMTIGFPWNQMRERCFERGKVPYRAKVVLMMMWTGAANVTWNASSSSSERRCIGLWSSEVLCLARKWAPRSMVFGAPGYHCHLIFVTCWLLGRCH